MTTEQLLAFNLALLAAIIVPGPAFLVAVQTTLAHGRAAGLATGGGLAVMAATWTLAALLGLDALFELFPWAYGAGKLAGAIYLLYVAYRIWRGGDTEQNWQLERRYRGFWRGFMVNLFKPKSVLFAGAVLVVVFPATMTAVENATVVVNHLGIELLFYAVLAWAMSSRRISACYRRVKIHVDRGASIVLASLGMRMLWNR